MRLNLNFMWLGALVALALFAAGCGGISASKTISPIDFLMPGILKNDVSGATNAPFARVASPAGSVELASVR